jgi:hypothetical protein
LFGANIVPTAADVAPSGGQLAWTNLFLNWASRWPNWVKPQIDHLAGNGIGANCIRMIGAQEGVVNSLFTQSYHDACMEQMVQYCSSLGVSVFMCTGGTQAGLVSAIGGGLTPAQLAAIQATTIRRVGAYDNVIGCDLIQESQSGNIGNSFIRPMAQAVRSAVPWMPITCSASVVNTATGVPAPGPRGEDWLLGISDGPILPWFDFISIHCYFRAINATFWDQFFAAAPDYDVIIGEFGRALSTGPVDPPTEATRLLQASDFARWLEMGNAPDRRVRGALLWACTDQNTNNNERWGAYSDVFAARPWVLDVVKRYTGGSVARANFAFK